MNNRMTYIMDGCILSKAAKAALFAYLYCDIESTSQAFAGNSHYEIKDYAAEGFSFPNQAILPPKNTNWYDKHRTGYARKKSK